MLTYRNVTTLSWSTLVLASIASACSSGSPASPGLPVVPLPPKATVTGYRIASTDGSALTAVAGDGKRLSVVQTLSDGTTSPLPAEAHVTWSGPSVITALPIQSMPPASILPQPGSTPAVFWLENPDHFTSAQLAGVLWVLDAGGPNQTVRVTATDFIGTSPIQVAALVPPIELSASISIAPMPAGTVARGQVTYGANCAVCHGATGQGTSEFPGLNAAPGHVAGDPTWSPALLAMTARSDMDNNGVSLDPSMPKWLVRPSATGHFLATQDFADVYAFLQTQMQ
jgi:mono/diheme cytochrome c family protein